MSGEEEENAAELKLGEGEDHSYAYVHYHFVIFHDVIIFLYCCFYCLLNFLIVAAACKYEFTFAISRYLI